MPNSADDAIARVLLSRPVLAGLIAVGSLFWIAGVDLEIDVGVGQPRWWVAGIVLFLVFWNAAMALVLPRLLSREAHEVLGVSWALPIAAGMIAGLARIYGLIDAWVSYVSVGLASVALVAVTYVAHRSNQG